MNTSHEKRNSLRIEVNFSVSIELPNKKQIKAIAINIGKGGMLVDCASSVFLSQLDDVNLYLPINHNQNNYAIAAKITHINDSKIGLFFYSDPSDYISELLSESER